MFHRLRKLNCGRIELKNGEMVSWVVRKLSQKRDEFGRSHRCGRANGSQKKGSAESGWEAAGRVRMLRVVFMHVW